MLKLILMTALSPWMPDGKAPALVPVEAPVLARFSPCQWPNKCGGKRSEFSI